MSRASVRIEQSFLISNRCYKQGRILRPSGLMLHSVGVNQPNAMTFVKMWNNEDCKVAVHGFIDANTGTVYQTLPWECRGWHAGGSANNTHIGVEMCEPDGIKYSRGAKFSVTGTKEKCLRQIETTYNSAVTLFASLCYIYCLNPLEDGVIISHAEGYTRGIASNHGDPEHLWRGFNTEYSMDRFRSDVYDLFLEEFVGQNGSFRIEIVLTDNLPWIRTGPGVQYPHIDEIQYIIKPGIYTIVEEKDGFGRLKSGIGWVNLSNKSVKR